MEAAPNIPQAISLTAILAAVSYVAGIRVADAVRDRREARRFRRRAAEVGEITAWREMMAKRAKQPNPTP